MDRSHSYKPNKTQPKATGSMLQNKTPTRRKKRVRAHVQSSTPENVTTTHNSPQSKPQPQPKVLLKETSTGSHPQKDGKDLTAHNIPQTKTQPQPAARVLLSHNPQAAPLMFNTTTGTQDRAPSLFPQSLGLVPPPIQQAVFPPGTFASGHNVFIPQANATPFVAQQPINLQLQQGPQQVQVQQPLTSMTLPPPSSTVGVGGQTAQPATYQQQRNKVTAARKSRTIKVINPDTNQEVNVGKPTTESANAPVSTGSEDTISTAVSKLLASAATATATSTDGSIDEHLAAVDQAMKEKGTLDHTVAHAGFVGPAGSGKSSLMTRLVGETPSSNSPSTGVADPVVQVGVRKSSSMAVSVFDHSSTWLKMLYDGEALGLAKLSSQHRVQKLASLRDAIWPNQVPMPSESPANDVELPSGYIPPREVFKQSLQHSQLEDLRQHFENSWSLYLTDTGGQMEFQELFPLLVSGPSIFLFTFRLDQGLRQQFTIDYRLPDGGRSDPYQSTLTVEEALLQTLASVASMGTFTYKGPQMESVPLKPKVMIVGTHKDRLSKATAESTIKEIDEYLQKLIKSTSHYREDLVEFASETRLIYTVNNFSEDDSDFQDIRAGVEQAVHRGQFEMSFPSPWLIFSFVLRQQTIKERVISYDQCSAIARDCGITNQQELKHALWFLHTKIGLIRHFPTPGLREIVIRVPQILFDRVTNLILNTFTFKNVGKRPLDEFKKKGIFRFEDFAKVSEESNPPSESQTSNPLTPEKLVQLLEHLRIVAQFEDENGQTKYFLPCVLAHSEVSKSQSSSDVPPLLITFACGYCPKGLYGALVTYLLVNEMGSEFKWEFKTDQIFRDQVSFRVGSYDIITLKVHPTYLELIHSSPLEKLMYSVKIVCDEVRHSVEKGIANISSDLNFTSDAKHSLSFYCENTDCVQKMGPHPATKIVIETDPAIMWCKRSVQDSLPSHPPDNYSVWFGQDSGLKDDSSTTVAAPVLRSRRNARPNDDPSPSDSGPKSRGTPPQSTPAFQEAPDCNRPTLATLTLLKWKDNQGQAQKLRLIQSVSPEWRKLGALVGLSGAQIQSLSQKHQLDPERCCTDVFGIHWLDNPPPNYPATWEGLGELLEDLELSQVAKSLQLALQHTRNY